MSTKLDLEKCCLSIVLGTNSYSIQLENDLYKLTDTESDNVYFYLTPTHIFKFFSKLYDKCDTRGRGYVQYELLLYFLKNEEEISLLLHVDAMCSDKKKFKKQFRRFVDLQLNTFVRLN